MRQCAAVPALAREVFLSRDFLTVSEGCATEGGRAALRALVLRSCWSGSGERVPPTPDSVKYARLRTFFRPEVSPDARRGWSALEPRAERWARRRASAPPAPLRAILSGESCEGVGGKFVLSSRIAWVLAGRPLVAVSAPFLYAVGPYMIARCFWPESGRYPFALYAFLVLHTVVYAVRLFTFLVGLAVGGSLSRILVAALLISNAAAYVKGSSSCFSDSRRAAAALSEACEGHSAFLEVRSGAVRALIGRLPLSASDPPSWAESCLQHARRTGGRDREALRAAWLIDALNSVAETASARGWAAADHEGCASLGPLSVKGALGQAFGFYPAG
jgi:hypothetical protein